jgi:hypothetical protein
MLNINRYKPNRYKTMKTSSLNTLLALLSAIGITAPSMQAATISLSASAPTVDGSDIAQLSDSGLAPFSVTGYTPVGDGSGDSGDVWGGRGAMGQTFTTLNNPDGYSLDSFSFKSHTGGSNANAGTSTYTFRIGTISGTTFTTLASGSANPNDSFTAGDWLTMTFDSPFSLSAGTEYAIDIRNPNTSFAVTVDGAWGWRTAGEVDSSYTEGSAYVSGFNGGTVPDDSNVAFPTIDRVFHVNLAAIPEPSSSALLGLGGLALMLRRKRS